MEGIDKFIYYSIVPPPHQDLYMQNNIIPQIHS